MTFLTLGSKCGWRGESGLAGSSLTGLAAMPSCCRSALSAMAPTPTPHWPKKWRRVCDLRWQISDFRFRSSLAIGKLLFARDECVGVQNCPADENKGGTIGGVSGGRQFG